MLSIHMHDDGRVRMVRDEENGQPQKIKHVALQDLIGAFQDQAMASPILPPGTVQYWRSFNNQVLAVYTPAHKRTMSLCGEEYENMPVPATLLVVQLYSNDNGFGVSNSAMYTMAGDFQGPNTQLYSFPYGNLFDDSRICWGEVQPNLGNVFQVGSLVDVFLGSDFNLDLTGLYRHDRMAENDEEYVDLPTFWKRMQGQEQIPTNLLRDVGQYRNIEDLLYFIRN